MTTVDLNFDFEKQPPTTFGPHLSAEFVNFISYLSTIMPGRSKQNHFSFFFFFFYNLLLCKNGKKFLLTPVICRASHEPWLGNEKERE